MTWHLVWIWFLTSKQNNKSNNLLSNPGYGKRFGQMSSPSSLITLLIWCSTLQIPTLNANGLSMLFRWLKPSSLWKNKRLRALVKSAASFGRVRADNKRLAGDASTLSVHNYFASQITFAAKSDYACKKHRFRVQNCREHFVESWQDCVSWSRGIDVDSQAQIWHQVNLIANEQIDSGSSKGRIKCRQNQMVYFMGIHALAGQHLVCCLVTIRTQS